MPKITIEGVDDLVLRLKTNAKMDDVKRIVRHNGSQLQRKMQQNADFRGHYEGKRFVSPTGTTKRSIYLVIEDMGMTAVVEPATEYAPYVEYGTRRAPNAQPFVTPAFNEQKEKFKADMDKLVR